VKDPTVRLVLDTSAVLAYAAGSIDLGEVITEVVDEAYRFGVPALCLVEAARLGGEAGSAGVRLLAWHPQCAILPLDAGDWEAVAEQARQLGRADLAVCLLEAFDRAGYVVTGEPHAYGDDVDELPIIAV
jgi:rRNA-processing protein FCF1